MTLYLLLLVLSSPTLDASSPYCQRTERAAFSEHAKDAGNDVRYHPRYCLMANREPDAGSLILHSQQSARVMRQLVRTMQRTPDADKVALADAVLYRASRRFWLSPAANNAWTSITPGLRQDNQLSFHGLRFFMNQELALYDDWWNYLQQGDFGPSYQPDIIRSAEHILYADLAGPKAAEAERTYFHCTRAESLSARSGHPALPPALFSPNYCLMLDDTPTTEALFLRPLAIEGIAVRFQEALTKLESLEQQASFIDLLLRRLTRLNWVSIALPEQTAAEQGVIRVHYPEERPERLQAHSYVAIDLFGEEPAELAAVLLHLQIKGGIDSRWPVTRLVDLVLFASEAEQPRAPAKQSD